MRMVNFKSASNGVLVDIRGLIKTFKVGNTLVEAIKQIDLRIDQGDFIAIIGPSGAGKSTLLNIIGCLDQPTAGAYYFSNQDVSGLSDIDLSLIRATRIGFVFQTFNLIQQLTVLQNVEVPFAYQNTDPKTAKKLATNAIERVGLSHRIKHRPSELSGGELQRVAIARAIAPAPSMILADEPTGNLDPLIGGEIMKLFVSLNKQGSTVILVTHDTGIAGYARHKLYLRNGRFEQSPI